MGKHLGEFVKDQLSRSPYIIAREQHPPNPITYNNPCTDSRQYPAAFFRFLLIPVKKSTGQLVGDDAYI